MCLWARSCFGLQAKDKEVIHSEVFDLCFVVPGFTFHDVYTMPIHLRKFYARRYVTIMEQREAEHNRVQKKELPGPPLLKK